MRGGGDRKESGEIGGRRWRGMVGDGEAGRVGRKGKGRKEREG